ncbi:hypothetical protein [Seinonella peptonophila]|uniref:hypothetical protein n=1 Tax=Seinonella peptonophila TaxID=112248 RepID=UPI001114BA1C|nr:hypothetical protein [Seinonella peptonophila]
MHNRVILVSIVTITWTLFGCLFGGLVGYVASIIGVNDPNSMPEVIRTIVLSISVNGLIGGIGIMRYSRRYSINSNSK